MFSKSWSNLDLAGLSGLLCFLWCLFDFAFFSSSENCCFSSMNSLFISSNLSLSYKVMIILYITYYCISHIIYSKNFLFISSNLSLSYKSWSYHISSYIPWTLSSSPLIWASLGYNMQYNDCYPMQYMQHPSNIQYLQNN